MARTMIVEEIAGVYRILRLSRLRETPGVAFDVLPPRLVPRVDAIDRVIHETGAISPGSVGEVVRPWYMHPDQDDHLLVLDGKRYVDLYSPILGKVLSFEVEPNLVTRVAPSPRSVASENVNSQAFSRVVICDSACMLVWNRGVFHRIRSDAATGSRSVNLATHYEGFNIDTNFSVYDLNTETGEYWEIRRGSEDQSKLPE